MRVAQAIEYYVDSVGERVWIAIWKIYKTKSHIQLRESAELRKLQFTGNMHKDIRDCILPEKGRVAEAAQDILEQKIKAKEILRRRAKEEEAPTMQHQLEKCLIQNQAMLHTVRIQQCQILQQELKRSTREQAAWSETM